MQKYTVSVYSFYDYGMETKRIDRTNDPRKAIELWCKYSVTDPTMCCIDCSRETAEEFYAYVKENMDDIMGLISTYKIPYKLDFIREALLNGATGSFLDYDQCYPFALG